MASPKHHGVHTSPLPLPLPPPVTPPFKQESASRKEVMGRVINRLLNRHVYMCFFKLSEYKAHQKQKRGALIKVAGILKIINIYIYIYI